MALRQTMPPDHRELVAGMIGSLVTQFGLVMAWWFSSTEGSARTKELLAKSQPIIEPLDMGNRVGV
jgi:hypothetical protein